MIEEVKGMHQSYLPSFVQHMGSRHCFSVGIIPLHQRRGCSKVTHLVPSSFASQSSLSSLNLGPISAYSTKMMALLGEMWMMSYIHDLHLITEEAVTVSLKLNLMKSKLITDNAPSC